MFPLIWKIVALLPGLIFLFEKTRFKVEQVKHVFLCTHLSHMPLSGSAFSPPAAGWDTNRASVSHRIQTKESVRVHSSLTCCLLLLLMCEMKLILLSQAFENCCGWEHQLNAYGMPLFSWKGKQLSLLGCSQIFSKYLVRMQTCWQILGYRQAHFYCFTFHSFFVIIIYSMSMITCKLIFIWHLYWTLT